MAPIDTIETQTNSSDDRGHILAAVDEMWEDVLRVVITSHTL